MLIDGREIEDLILLVFSSSARRDEARKKWEGGGRRVTDLRPETVRYLHPQAECGFQVECPPGSTIPTISF